MCFHCRETVESCDEVLISRLVAMMLLAVFRVVQGHVITNT